jgi:2-phosphosulfolactate phosphatase
MGNARPVLSYRQSRQVIEVQTVQFQRLSLDESAHAKGTVVVIDVIRAFTSACYAFSAGAEKILLVSEIEHALELREKFPGALLMGEVGGGPIEGFDFSNSPAHYIDHDLSGLCLIQRTSNGTQGVIRAMGAYEIVAASFVCAGATARYIQKQAPAIVTFVITAWHANSPEPQNGDEDAACADYIEALLTTGNPDPTPYLARVANSPTGKLFQSNTRPEYPATDLPYCLQLDRFNFALPIQRQPDGLLIMRPFKI